MTNRIIIPLDMEYTSAVSIADKLDPNICRLKVGNQLFTSSGPKIVKTLHDKGFEIFLDLKFHDIPNTVYESVRSAANLGVWMINVHASGGSKMLDASKKALEGFDKPPLLVGVTILTSISEEILTEIGFNNLDKQVMRLTKLAQRSGLDGVVCAASDASKVKQTCGESFLTVTPGIRPRDADLNDQSRTSTPKEAIANGSDFLVIGRPITGSEDPTNALENIYKEVS
ncbi:MAG: orotidine-5'-phosphate decarboxylase [Gammaproteobacteria bacterium]|nr:orotidine-5'-phosphate decarboxylase [Gammaproteobacteria bacterium]|tara:strand:- start:543 stop:1226 length:684 start_codon:yes stop_codon:yes gene_type:complete